jgi:hypothetical protein
MRHERAHGNDELPVTTSKVLRSILAAKSGKASACEALLSRHAHDSAYKNADMHATH